MASLTTTTTNTNNNNDKQMKQDYIIHFTWKHQNFWKGELDSILQLFQLKPSEIYNKTDLDNITSPHVCHQILGCNAITIVSPLHTKLLKTPK